MIITPTITYDEGRHRRCPIRKSRPPKAEDRVLNQSPQTAEPALLFDPASPEVIANPYPFYHRLRAADPVHRSPLGYYLVSRHAEASSVTSASARILSAS